MIRFGASEGGTTTIIDGTGQSQKKTTLAAITGAGIASPLGLWNLDGTVTEEVTGGAGYDLVNGVDQVPGWEIVKGLPLASDTLMCGWFNGDASFSANGGGNPGSVWNIDGDLTVMCWLRSDSYRAVGDDNDHYIAVGYVHPTTSTIGTGTAPPYLLGMTPRINAVEDGTVYFEYVDNTGAVGVKLYWEIGSTGRYGKTANGNWFHLAATRVRNGVDDNDVALFLNGVSVATLTGQKDCNLPTSVNMVLQFGESFNQSDGWAGGMRDVAIWNSQLTPAEIQTMYELGIETG